MCYYLRGIDLPNANSYERHMKYLKSLKIAIPPLAEQKKIVLEIEKCEHEIAVAEARLASAAADKSAILARLLQPSN